jgi:ketosteroid isomerase-like protein
MIRTLIPAALLALTPAAALADAHTEASEPAAAVTAFMDAFNAKDAETMTALVLEGATVTVVEERDGPDRMALRPMSDLIASIASSPVDVEEPIWNMQVTQEGPVATVVATFDFLIDGMRSHCGTNVFNLVRVDGEWMIAGIAYSHIEEGCLGEPEE